VLLPTSSSSSYNANNQISISTLGSAQYDTAGGVTVDNQNQYLYDGDGRVCAVRNLMFGTMTGYIYGADGARVSTGSISAWGSCDPTTNGYRAMKDSILGPSGGQLTEMGMDTNGNMAWSHTNVWAGGQLLATYDPNGLHFYLTDWVGSRRVQTDYEGVVEQTCANLPYGNGVTCGPDPANELFAGLGRDSESGLDHAMYRQYSSTYGRWTTPDPYGGSYDWTNPQSLNRYAYVNGSPLAAVDPSGLFPFACIPSPGVFMCTGVGLLGVAVDSAPIPVVDIAVDIGIGLLELGKDLGWWDAQPKFTGNVSASQTGKNVPNQSNNCPNGTRDATPQEEQQILQQARSQIGKPYFSGGGIRSCPANGFDCSGFVSWSIKAAGFAYTYSPTASMGGNPFLRTIDPSQIRSGDIIAIQRARRILRS
jgi:RHS repeat-associated protein